MPETILVTGANGFIGRHLVEFLLENGQHVKGFIHSHDTPEFLPQHAENFEWVRGDLKTPESLIKAVDHCDRVFHLAALSRYDPRVPDAEYHRVNVEGTRWLLEASRAHHVKRFIYVSSNEAVGLSDNGQPLTEESVPHPPNVYGRSKLEAESIVQSFYTQQGMETIIVRPYTTYGPGGGAAFRRYFKPISTGFFLAFGDGSALMEFGYVKNLVYGLWLTSQNGRPGEIYCLSDARSYSYKEIAQEIAAQMRVRLRLISIPFPLAWIAACMMEGLNRFLRFYPFYMKDTGRPLFSRQTLRWAVKGASFCSVEKAKRELGYHPPYSLQEGLQETIAWFREQGWR